MQSVTLTSRSTSTSPNMFCAASKLTWPLPNTETCSSAVMASRIPPLAFSAMRLIPSASYVKPSPSQICSKHSQICPVVRLWKSKRWQRDTMVCGTLCASVVHITNTMWSGGSSKVLSSALNAPVDSM